MKKILLALLIVFLNVGAYAQKLGSLTLQLDTISNKKVSLRWNNPEPINGLFDDFESHTDFAINSQGSIGWQYLDADNQNTYTWTAADYPGQGKPMAFMVFNPSKTSPSTESWPDIQPYSGKKFLLDMTVDGGNNDYIISPELSFKEDFQFSFQARSYNETYGKERFRVGYSTTGQNPSDFIFIQEGDYEEVPAAWTLCSYKIPKEARYVCLNCVSQEAFMFMVDDIFIGTNIVRPQSPKRVAYDNKLAGFNLLRDGAKINSDLIVGTIYNDSVSDYGSYTYTLQAVMNDGSIALKSDPLQVEVPDIRLLPFEDDFDATTIDTDKWSMPIDEAGNENKWRRDYYAYGLVDYSACYPYSRIGENYSQSLVSRELRTQDANNTYIRFQVRLDNNEKYTGSYLSAEVSIDGGITWTSLVNIANDEGSFDWRTYEYSLANVLDGAEFFYVRFRAHGADSWNIAYWYVDDVKVWCPQTRAVTLNATSATAPVADASICLTADNGAVYEGKTDNEGTFIIPRMELGTYTVDVTAIGYNIYSGEWTLTADGSDVLNVKMSQPIISWSTANIDVNMPQESIDSIPLTLNNSGDGQIYWNLTPKPKAQSGTTTHQFEPGFDFDASGDLQSSVAFDGEYFYTASIYTLGRYYKYDKEGHFIEEFSIPGMYFKLYDLTYDGTYFYGSDYSSYIYKLDFRNKRLVGKWQVKGNSSLEITHISYDPRSDQFWLGDWTTVGRVDRDGNVTVSFLNVGSSSDDIAVMGSAFDNVSAGGPYLWFSNLAYSEYNTIDKLQLLQYDLNNRRLTGVQHTATDVPGYKVGTTEVPNNLGGITMTTQFNSGELTLVGILIQSPSHIFTYRMADFDSWYSVSPMSGTLNAGEKADLTVSLSTRDFTLNEQREATLSFGSMPTMADVADLQLKLKAGSASTAPHPIGLTAKIDSVANNVNLSWQAAQGSSPTAYEVMRDSVKIATVEGSTQYTDSTLTRGVYAYAVRALYGNDGSMSILSDTIQVEIKVGAPYFAPVELTAAIEKNKDVTLLWKQPDARLHSEATLRWDSAKNDEAVGVSGGGYFYAGVKFDADDIEPYRGMTLSSVDVFIKERVTALSLRIYKDGKSIVTQRVQPASINYGEFNTVGLTSPITLERGSSYIVAFMVMHDADLTPLGVNSATTVEGKSNLMSEDGRNWYPASYAGYANYNFNIAANLVPTDSYTEEMPAAYIVMRNGQEVGHTQLLKYTETVDAPADYTYTVVSLYDGGGKSAQSNNVSVTVEDIGTPIAPSHLNATLERNRNVELRWTFPIASEPSVPVDISNATGVSPEGRPELVSSFRGALTGETGIASDGHYIYTTRYSAAGIINRYKMDGTFDESMGLATSLDEGFRNLTFDGTDFWASANGSEIHKLNLTVPKITDTRSISEVARHLTYVPMLDSGRGGFEVGDWDTSIKVSMQGAKLGDGPTLNGAAGSAYYDGILYTFEQGYETPYELCARNFATGELLWHESIADWTGIVPSSSASAGGMSVLNTSEGLHLLCVALQESQGSRFMFFDLGSVKGLSGYNVYRNGVKINAEPIAHRRFAEQLTEPGDYTYQIQTEYIDGSVSELSEPETITIEPATPGDAPTDIKVKATTAGYDVNLSIVDPTSLLASQYESFEDETSFSMKGFVVSGEEAFSGSRSLKAPSATSSAIILPISNNYDSDFSLSFVARNANDDEGAGTIQVLTSSRTNIDADFVSLASLTTTEAWTEYSFTVPAATRYVALRVPSCYADQYIDAIAIDKTKVGRIYGYDVMRDGVTLNGSEPVAGVTYTDHNLLPGTYSYQVRAYYDNSSVSQWSDAVEVTIDYSNGHQAPGQLSVSQTDTGNILEWSAPALSAVKELRWHNGISYSAAGMPSGGSYYAGVQFTTDDQKDYASMSISEVSFYINQVPDVLYVQLYQGSDLVFEKYVPTLKQYSMNTVRLDTPIRIDASRTLRAVVYVEHNSITVPLGYDEGPAKTGLGDLYSSDGTTWSTLTDNDIDGNWNISIGLQAYASSEYTSGTSAAKRYSPIERYVRHAATVKAPLQDVPTAVPYRAPRSARKLFDGYNVYCNGERLNADTLDITQMQYVDAMKHKGRYYEYQVKAIYGDYGEVGSNIVRILATDIDNINAEMDSTSEPVYTITGIRADEHQRGVVIQRGEKRVRK